MLKPDLPHTNLVDGSAAVTASANYDFDRGHYSSFIASLDVTAESGTTPTLDVKFQDSADNGTTWNDIPSGAFTQVTTSNSQQRLAISGPIGSKLRAVSTLGGTTPSYTFTLDVCGCDS